MADKSFLQRIVGDKFDEMDALTDAPGVDVRAGMLKRAENRVRYAEDHLKDDEWHKENTPEEYRVEHLVFDQQRVSAARQEFERIKGLTDKQTQNEIERQIVEEFQIPDPAQFLSDGVVTGDELVLATSQSGLSVEKFFMDQGRPPVQIEAEHIKAAEEFAQKYGLKNPDESIIHGLAVVEAAGLTQEAYIEENSNPDGSITIPEADVRRPR